MPLVPEDVWELEYLENKHKDMRQKNICRMKKANPENLPYKEFSVSWISYETAIFHEVRCLLVCLESDLFRLAISWGEDNFCIFSVSTKNGTTTFSWEEGECPYPHIDMIYHKLQRGGLV